MTGRSERYPHEPSTPIQRSRLPPSPRRVRADRHRHQDWLAGRPGDFARQRRHDVDQAPQARERVPHGILCSLTVRDVPPARGDHPDTESEMTGHGAGDDPACRHPSHGTVPVHTIRPHPASGRSPIGREPGRDSRTSADPRPASRSGHRAVPVSAIRAALTHDPRALAASPLQRRCPRPPLVSPPRLGP